MLISIIRFSIFSPINLQPAERSKLTAAGLSRHVTEPRTHRARTLAIYLERRAATRAEFIIKSCSVLVYLVTVKGAQCSTSSLRPPLNNVSASEYRQHRLTRNCAKGKIFKQEMQLTPFLNRVTLKCTGRARAAAVHVAARAAVIACRELCTHRCDILTSLRLRHFPFALMRGRGSTKDFAFFLTPSLHRPRTGASAACLGVFFFFFATKMQRCKIQASIFMHLEPFCVRSVRVRARSAGTSARPPQPSGKQVILQLHCKEFSAALT